MTLRLKLDPLRARLAPIGRKLDRRSPQRRPREWIDLARDFAEDAASAVEGPLEAMATAYLAYYSRRQDAARGDAVEDDLARLAQGFRLQWSNVDFATLVDGHMQRLTAAADDDLSDQVEQVVGVRPDLTATPAAGRAMSRASRQTINLMRGVQPDAKARMSEIVLEGFRKGSATEVVGRRLEEATGIGRRRAQFVARNEMGNLYATHTRVRQQELGITRYRWRTSRDERVRASHGDKEGEIFAWTEPPADTGHPGADFNCRCTAEPVLEDLELEEVAPVPAEASVRRLREQAGLSQRALAEKIGRSTSWLGNVERGKASASPEDLAKLKRALLNEGVDADELNRIFPANLPTLEEVTPPPAPLPTAPYEEISTRFTELLSGVDLDAMFREIPPYKREALTPDALALMMVGEQLPDQEFVMSAIAVAMRAGDDALVKKLQRFAFELEQAHRKFGAQIARRQKLLELEGKFAAGEFVTASEALERLKRSGGRGRKLKPNMQTGHYFESDRQVVEFVEARRRAELDKIPALREIDDLREQYKRASNEIGEIVSQKMAIRRQIFEAIDSKDSAAEARLRAEMRAKEAIHQEVSDRRDKALNRGAEILEDYLEDLKADVENNSAYAVQFGRWRQADGKLRPEGEMPRSSDVWDKDARARKIPKGARAAPGPLGELFGDVRSFVDGEPDPIRACFTRARAYHSSDHINVGKQDWTQDSDSVFFHEVGHWLEDQNKALEEASKRFIIAKAQEVNAVVRDEHGNGELRFMGVFDENYTARIYSSTGGRVPADGDTADQYTFEDLRSTEISSMAMQEFTNVEGLTKTALKDPDRFWWGVALSRGDFR